LGVPGRQQSNAATATPNAARDSEPAFSEEIRAILDSPEVSGFVREREEARETGRIGYGWRALVGAWMVRYLDDRASWKKTARTIRDNPNLIAAIGGEPSESALYRFSAKLLHDPTIVETLKRLLTAAYREQRPGYGVDAVIDGTFIKAYSNGQRYVRKGGAERKRFSDSDATWGHVPASSTRGASGGFGFKVMSLVCARTEQPVDWLVVTAKAKEHFTVGPLLDSAAALGFRIETLAGDKAYDTRGTYDRISARGVVPIIECGNRVQKNDVRPPICEHGVWTPAGTDWQRREVRYRCPNWRNPTNRCARWSVRLPESRLICLIPRETERWWKFRNRRGAVERAFKLAKHEHRLDALRARGLARATRHVDMVYIAWLALALVRARGTPVQA